MAKESDGTPDKQTALLADSKESASDKFADNFDDDCDERDDDDEDTLE